MTKTKHTGFCWIEEAAPVVQETYNTLQQYQQDTQEDAIMRKLCKPANIISLPESAQESNKWNLRYLELAKFVSTWSKDPRKKVGAVITEKRKVKGIGYNGFPHGIEDHDYRLNDKQLKNLIIIHAEVNALHSSDGRGDTIYVYPCLPCTQCLGHIIQYGIKTIVTLPATPEETSWNQDLVLELAREANINIVFEEEL